MNPSNTTPFKLGFLAGVLNRGLGLIGIARRFFVSECATMSAGVRAPVDRGNATTDFAEPGADPEAFFLMETLVEIRRVCLEIATKCIQIHPNPGLSSSLSL